MIVVLLIIMIAFLIHSYVSNYVTMRLEKQRDEIMEDIRQKIDYDIQDAMNKANGRLDHLCLILANLIEILNINPDVVDLKKDGDEDIER